MEPGTSPGDSMFANPITIAEFVLVLVIQGIAVAATNQPTLIPQRTLKIIDLVLITALIVTAVGIMVVLRRGSVLQCALIVVGLITAVVIVSK